MTLPIFRAGAGLALILLGLSTLWSCRSKPTAAAPSLAEAFTRHPAWVSTSFTQALQAGSDSLYASNCFTLRLEAAVDSLWLDFCHQESAHCAYRVRDARILEITSGLGEEPVLLRLEGRNRAVLSGGALGTIIFEPMPAPAERQPDPIATLVAARLAGTYLPLDPQGQPDPANPIRLDSSGVAKGLDNLVHFVVAVGGDRQAGPFNLIYFQTADQQEKPYAWRLHRDTLLLCPAVLVSAPDEKPSYDLGQPWQPYLLQPR